jgi:hypothetical protein
VLLQISDFLCLSAILFSGNFFGLAFSALYTLLISQEQSKGATECILRFFSRRNPIIQQSRTSHRRRVRYAVMLPFAVLVQVAAAQCSAQQLLSAKKNQHEWMQQTMLHF